MISSTCHYLSLVQVQKRCQALGLYGSPWGSHTFPVLPTGAGLLTHHGYCIQCPRKIPLIGKLIGCCHPLRPSSKSSPLLSITTPPLPREVVVPSVGHGWSINTPLLCHWSPMSWPFSYMSASSTRLGMPRKQGFWLIYLDDPSENVWCLEQRAQISRRVEWMSEWMNEWVTDWQTE